MMDRPKPQKRSMKKMYFTCGVVLVFLLVGYWVLSDQSSSRMDKDAIQLKAVEQGPFNVYVVGNGAVIPRDVDYIMPKADGELMRAIGIEERFIDRKYIGSSVLQLVVGVGAGVAFSLVVLPKLPNSILITNMNTLLAASGVVAVVVGLLVFVSSYVPLLSAHKMSPRDAMNSLSLNND